MRITITMILVIYMVLVTRAARHDDRYNDIENDIKLRMFCFFFKIASSEGVSSKNSLY